MRRYAVLLTGFLFTYCCTWAQPPAPADKKGLLIVDSLSNKERTNRQTLLLRSELDSMIQLYNDSIAQLKPIEPEVKKDTAEMNYEWIILASSLVIIGLLLYLLLRNQQRFRRTIEMLNAEVKELQYAVQQQEEVLPPPPVSRARQSAQALEKKLQAITATSEKMNTENEQLKQSLQNLQQQAMEYETIKQLMTQVYKMRNYPGYSKERTETEIVKGVLETERSVSQFAYERFVKPIITIADAHKNDPARLPAEARQQVIDNLVSLGLLYSEYLYLRVPELTIGGKIIERMGSIRQQQPDFSSLKELSTEHGSRALVIRIALEKMGITSLGYPVFDETNLNLS